METFDKKTEEIAAAIIAKFDEAMIKSDLAEMQRIAILAASTPNHPLQQALMRHLEFVA